MEDPSASPLAQLDRPSVRDILVWGLQDWIDLGFARQYVSDEIGDVGPVELRAQTIDVLAALLQAGLVVAGELTQKGFERWPLDAARSVARLRAEWDVPEAPLHAGDACWFEITEKGRTRAESLETDP